MLQQYIHTCLVVSTVIYVIIRIRMFITLLTTVCHWIPVLSPIKPVPIFMPYFVEGPYTSVYSQVFQVFFSIELRPLKVLTHFSSPQVCCLSNSGHPQFDSTILNVMTTYFFPPAHPPVTSLCFSSMYTSALSLLVLRKSHPVFSIIPSPCNFLHRSGNIANREIKGPKDSSLPLS